VTRKTTFTAVPTRYAPKLREHVLTSPDSTPSERAKARQRDEKGRMLPLNPQPEPAK
jgi:hypothetical protein